MTRIPEAMPAELESAPCTEQLSWLEDYLPRLSTMGVQLTETSTQIEESVVNICRDFQGIAERAQATVQQTSSFLGKESTGQQQRSFNSLIQKCSGTLVKILNTAAEASEASRQAVERILKMDEASQQISTALLKLEEIANGNRILALNARIEAVRSGVQGNGFDAVAVELSNQTEKSRAVTSQVEDLAESLRLLAESTMKDLRALQSREEQRIDACREEVNQTLDELRTAHSEMEAKMYTVTKDGTKLAGDIQSAIRGLQFQDAVSQRLAHVVEDLGVMQAKLTARARGEFGADGADEMEYSAYTMKAERSAAQQFDDEAAGGDVELF